MSELSQRAAAKTKAVAKTRFGGRQQQREGEPITAILERSGGKRSDYHGSSKPSSQSELPSPVEISRREAIRRYLNSQTTEPVIGPNGGILKEDLLSPRLSPETGAYHLRHRGSNSRTTSESAPDSQSRSNTPSNTTRYKLGAANLKNESGMVGYADGRKLTPEKVNVIENALVDAHNNNVRADHAIAAAFMACGISFKDQDLSRRELMKNVALVTGGLAFLGLGGKAKAEQGPVVESRFQHTRERMAQLDQQSGEWVSLQAVPLNFGFDSRSIGIVVDKCSAGNFDSIQLHMQFIRADDGIADPANAEGQRWQLGMWTHQDPDPICNYRQGVTPIDNDLRRNAHGDISDLFGLYNTTFQNLSNGYRVPSNEYDADFVSSQNYLGEGVPRVFKVNMVPPKAFRDQVKDHFVNNPDGKAVLQIAQVSNPAATGFGRIQIVATPPESREVGVANPLVATDHNSFTGDYRSFAFGGGTDPDLIPGTIAIQPGGLRDNLVETRVALNGLSIDSLNGQVSVTLETDLDGDIYRIESSSDFVNWETCLESLGDGGRHTHQEPIANRKFFRASKYSNNGQIG